MGLFQQDAAKPSDKARPRNIVMLSMGSILGAGLFVGVGNVYETAGSGMILLFLMIGFAAIVVNLFLIEMNLKGPSEWCFPQYVEDSFGPLYGYLVGWAYIGSMVIGPASELVAAGMILKSIFPQAPLFFLCLLAGGFVAGLNRLKNSWMEEVRFFTAFLKIFGLLSFCLLGLSALCHLFSGIFYSQPVYWPIQIAPLFSRGRIDVMAASMGVIMIYGGTESIGLLATGQENRSKTGIPAETFNIALRIVFINCFSAFILIGIMGRGGDQRSPYPDTSLFLTALQIIGCSPPVIIICRLLILLAAVSLALTSSLPTSQMLMLQVRSGYLKGIAKLENEKRLPFKVQILPELLIFLCLILVNIWQEYTYIRLFYFSGFCFMFIWLMITITYPRYCGYKKPADYWKVPCARLLQPLILCILLFSLLCFIKTRIGRETLFCGGAWFLLSGLSFFYGKKKNGGPPKS